MLPSRFSQFVPALALLFLILEVRSQNIRFDTDGQRNRPVPSPSLCDADSTCRQIRQCGPFRSLPNWREIGITCGRGGGTYRRVCCPNRSGPIRVPVQPISTTTQGSLVPRDSSRNTTVYNFNQGECGQSRAENIRTEYVIGGEVAKEGAWPWMAAIRIQERSGIYTPYCTGFLIDRKHVVSAAHCYHNKNPEDYITRIGRVNQDEGETYGVGRIAVHEGYTQGKFYNDIAILTLTRDVDFPGFNPICLPNEVIINKDLTGFGTAVAGWGVDSIDGGMSIVLREIRRMPVVSNRNCTTILRNTQDTMSFRRRFPQGISKGLICAGFTEGKKDACGGDSGGPLMRQENNTWFVVGIVSFGYSCGQPGVPGGYTRITEYMKFIWENTRD